MGYGRKEGRKEGGRKEDGYDLRSHGVVLDGISGNRALRQHNPRWMDLSHCTETAQGCLGSYLSTHGRGRFRYVFTVRFTTTIKVQKHIIVVGELILFFKRYSSPHPSSRM